MKYTYIHCATDQHLICCETHEKVYVDFPTSLELVSIPNIVKDREREAIERYEKNHDKESTPLEALKELRSFCGDVYYQKIYDKDLGIIENALKRLEDIDSHSSMRMENIVPHLFEDNEELKKRLNEMYELRDRNQKKLKALEIIKEKRVDVFGLICCIQLNEYTALETYNLKENCHNYKLTKEEYDLLKEVLL